MGMFDHVKCDFPLPDGWAPVDLQSKDGECRLSTLWITAGGTMFEDISRAWFHTAEEPAPTPHWRRVPFNGEFHFYGYERRNKPGEPIDLIWHRYIATFIEGNLQELRMEDDRDA